MGVDVAYISPGENSFKKDSSFPTGWQEWAPSHVATARHLNTRCIEWGGLKEKLKAKDRGICWSSQPLRILRREDELS